MRVHNLTKLERQSRAQRHLPVEPQLTPRNARTKAATLTVEERERERESFKKRALTVPYPCERSNAKRR